MKKFKFFISILSSICLLTSCNENVLNLSISVSEEDSNSQEITSSESLDENSSTSISQESEENSSNNSSTIDDNSSIDSETTSETKEEEKLQYKFSLLEDDILLSIDQVVIIAYFDDNISVAVSKESSSNYREAININIIDNEITLTDDSNVARFIIKEGTKTDTIAFYDEVNNGYLSASSSTQNRMKLSSSLTDECSFLISGERNKTITSQGSYTRNTLCYNKGNPRFSLYSSTNPQALVSLFISGEIEPIYPTNIKASAPSSLRINKTAQVEVTFTPKNTNQKNLSFYSSDENICKVSDMGILTGVGVGNVTIRVTAKDINNNDLVSSFNVEVEEISNDKYTILIYMCGSDLESQYGEATDNLKEILSVSNQPDDVNIVIETGGAKKWSSTYGISASYLERYHVENKSLIKDERLTKVSMGKSSTLQSFLEYGLTTYPADNVGLVLWNHGGAIDGVCFDENYNDDSLTASEVISAVSGAISSTNNSKLAFIGYDACLMSVQDIAELNSPYFDYMIASEESEPGGGWDYDYFLKYLYADSNISITNLLSKIADGYYVKVADAYNSYGGSYRGYNDTTMAVLDLSKISTYKDEFEKVATSLSQIVTSNSMWSSLKTVLNSVTRFGYDDDYGYTFDVFDAGQFLTKLNTYSNFKSVDTSKALEAYNDVIVYFRVGSSYSSTPTGMCLIAAISSYLSKTTYNASTNFRNWYDLNAKYGSFY